MNEFKLKDLVNAEAFAAPNWGGDLASLREDLDPLVAQGYAVVLFAGTPKGAAALTRDLADKGYAVSMSRDVRPTTVSYTHLDVYKRQRPRYCRHGARCSCSCRG